MNRCWLWCLMVVFVQQTVSGKVLNRKDVPDSAYLFSYATTKNNNHDGLQFAWSRDKETWHVIGEDFSYLKSDYGPWGSEKRMITPYLYKDAKGLWHCVWSLNDKDHIFAHAASTDLINWRRQSYPMLQQGANCLRPVLQYNPDQDMYNVTYADANQKYYTVATHNFKSFSSAKEIPAASYVNSTFNIALPEGRVNGQLNRVPWAVIDRLIKYYEQRQYKITQNGEAFSQDTQRFAGLKTLEAAITVEPQKAKPISDMLVGVFFEDINYAADGGLYGELIQNRDFEYQLTDKKGRDKSWNSTHSWKLTGDNSTFTIDSVSPIHPNNSHYAVLNTQVPGAALINAGFDGIAVKAGEKYNFSVFTKQLNGHAGKLLVRLVSDKGGVLAQATINVANTQWKAQAAVLTASASATDVHLELTPQTSGRLALDMLSLFPQKTFKSRKNGMRADLAQAIADIHPRFVRFPGGCVSHGDGLANIYRWKNTIGTLEARKPQRNIWNYHQSAGLGYFEYFQFCEDIGAQPVPVVAAGVPCQNSSTGGNGQQGGIPMSEMNAYVQDILDLVEYANGDVSTTWGKKRAEAGHPKPFNLKYIGIGNEDLITDVFEERFAMIYKAMKRVHPEITVIGTVGPFFEGTDYDEGWDVATRMHVPMVDEHYYETSGWFINNQDFYDKYDRSKSKVYLGEYAAHLPGSKTNLETALAEALYLTSLERNGDVVSMSSYAPLLAREGHTQWNPDMIYFNNSEVKPTVAYYVQQLYGQNAGNQYLPSTVALSDTHTAVTKRVGISVVRDSQTQDLIVKLANLLPVAVHSNVDLKGISVANQKAVATILQGNPAGKDAKPVESTINVANKFTADLPAYSFTVIRIKTK
ncbi:alpha-L-arabinofuranosidase [Mucilaginibacter robiniae]|uniref:non-reducing end alpha-L-arabinofuranosidase n=2 Tax=Mucilaginibacter robiniae TaxID=2728022 RepID=A0A7L5E3F8_9SPHI|nr:alpha-L-arabinofuranosidase [Mucilaginibacter robiniae]